jgi:DSF synthase
MSAQPAYPALASGHAASPRFHRRVVVERREPDVQWVRMDPNPETGLQNFTPALVAEFQHLVDAMLRPAAVTAAGMHEVPRYTVVQSSHPDYFSVGGDLSFFRDCFGRGDAEPLRAYSMQCLDLMYGWSTKLKSRTASIALVQGRALGGGVEMVLSTDYVIAEARSSFGFPEIMFGLFPCTGAMGLLASRIGARAAERMMTNKRVYPAHELLDMGLIDEVCEDGQGEAAVARYIATHRRRQRALLKVQESRQRYSAIDYAEGVQVVEDWVELAMALSPEELRTMEMLILMQKSESSAARTAG